MIQSSNWTDQAGQVSLSYVLELDSCAFDEPQVHYLMSAFGTKTDVGGLGPGGLLLTQLGLSVQIKVVPKDPSQMVL